MAKFCKACGSSNIKTTIQQFRDGTEHHRLDCADCRTFNGYAKQNNGFDKTLILNHEYESKGCIDDIAQIIVEQLNNLDLAGRKLTLVLKAR